MSREHDYDNLGSVPLTPPPRYYQHLALNIQPEHLEGSQFVFAGLLLYNTRVTRLDNLHSFNIAKNVGCIVH